MSLLYTQGNDKKGFKLKYVAPAKYLALDKYDLIISNGLHCEYEQEEFGK